MPRKPQYAYLKGNLSRGSSRSEPDSSRQSSSRHEMHISKHAKKSSRHAPGYERIYPQHYPKQHRPQTAVSSSFDGSGLKNTDGSTVAVYNRYSGRSNNRTKSRVESLPSQPQIAPTCCRHGRRCAQGKALLLKEQQTAPPLDGFKDESSTEEEKSSAYEVADRYLKRESIPGKEIAPMRKSKKPTSPGSDLPSFLGKNMNESEVEAVLQKRKAFITSPIYVSGRSPSRSPLKRQVKIPTPRSAYRSAKSKKKDRSAKAASKKSRKYRERERDPLTDSESFIVLKQGDARASASSDVLTREKYAPQCSTMRRPVFQKMKMEGNYDERLYRYYLGEISPIEAERRTRERVSFRLYHQLPIAPLTSYDQLDPAYKLFVVYRCSKGYYFHYPVVKHNCRSSMGSVRTQLMVEFGEAAPFFNSMEALIKHYETYATFSGDASCPGLPDIFPWRTAEKEYCSETLLSRKAQSEQTNDSTTSCTE